MLEVFKYLRTNLNQNSVQDEIKGGLIRKAAIIRCRILCLPVSQPKFKDYNIQYYNFA
jgi:hypothetical protein